MQTLWSPWRKTYMENHTNHDECIFCRELTHPDGPDNLILFRGELAFVILNRYPYTNGHLMVVPFAHEDSLEKLDTATRSEMMELASHAIKVLRSLYNPDAFNVGVNIGEAAGAGVACHVHMHVVPRWSGDTNFMTTVGGARVIPEDLAQSYVRIKEAWGKV
jgi:ATP adenylyltransferase